MQHQINNTTICCSLGMRCMGSSTKATHKDGKCNRGLNMCISDSLITNSSLQFCFFAAGIQSTLLKSQRFSVFFLTAKVNLTRSEITHNLLGQHLWLLGPVGCFPLGSIMRAFLTLFQRCRPFDYQKWLLTFLGTIAHIGPINLFVFFIFPLFLLCELCLFTRISV